MSGEDEPFRSQRPDGKKPRDAYAAPPELLTLSRTELRQRSHKVEKKLYWSRHEPTAGGHADRAKYEKQWNDLQAAIKQQNGKTWIYKHDRRDEFTFHQQKVSMKDGSSRTNTIGEGKVHDSKTNIHWRSKSNTYGSYRYQRLATKARARGEISSGRDYSHLVANEHGADVEGVNRKVISFKTRNDPNIHRPNYSAQHSRSNQHRGWKTEDRRVSKAARENPVDLKVTSQTTNATGPHTELSRTMEARSTVNNQPIVIQKNNLIHMNPNDHLIARQRSMQKTKISEAAQNESLQKQTTKSQSASKATAIPVTKVEAQKARMSDSVKKPIASVPTRSVTPDLKPPAKGK